MLSRRYLRPMAEAFRQIKEGGGRTAQRTRIPEIDDLLEFLVRQDETAVPAYAPPPEQSALYRTFVENIQTLSAAERAVFDLYLQGAHGAGDRGDSVLGPSIPSRPITAAST